MRAMVSPRPGTVEKSRDGLPIVCALNGVMPVLGKRAGKQTPEEAFTVFVCHIEPRLRQAVAAVCGAEPAREAVQEALLYAWKHWDRVSLMDNAVGYLYRVARSRIEWPARLPAPEVSAVHRDPEVEPGLEPALRRLTERQRVAVFLVVGCDWSHRDAAALLGISVSSLRNHLARGLERLRTQLGVIVDA